MAEVMRALRSLLADCLVPTYTARAFVVLAALPEDGSLRGASELAEQVSLPAATVARYLKTLTELGLVEGLGRPGATGV
jgi:DNA-binding IclR family transcriptional regulator